MRKAVMMMLMVVSATALGQTKASERGIYGSTSVSAAYDDSIGWSGLLTSSVGYDFNRFISAEMGVPYNIVGANNSGSGKSALGDVYFRVQATPKVGSVGLKSGFRVGAPTGDLAKGFSTDKATWNWDNRVEKEFEHVTPFAEAGVGNTLPDSKRLRRAYTTYGNVGQFRGGLGFDLAKSVSIEVSGYDVVAFGDQTIYSHIVAKGSAGNTGANKHRPFESAYVTTGSSSVLEDNGFTGAVSVDPNQRVEFEVAFNRSVPQELSTVTLTVSFRLGHVQGKKE